MMNTRSNLTFIFLLAATIHPSAAFLATQTLLGGDPASSTSSSGTGAPPLTVCHAEFNVPGMWTRGNNFGKGQFVYYKSFENWMSPFPDEDKQAFPEIFSLPPGCYEVDLEKPLGIVFEEIEAGKGLYVQDLAEGGNAERSGKIKIGDNLVGITAVKIVGAKYERRLIPCRGFDFDTMVGAVGSNDPKWGCDGVVLLFERPDEADSAKVDKFLEFFEPPFDTPWKQQQ